MSACLHVTSETANLAITLRDGGADVVLCASNPLSTQDDSRRVVWSRTTAFRPTPSRAKTTPPITRTSARRSITSRRSPWTTAPTWSPCCSPSAQNLMPDVIGGTEETTTGVIRLRAMAKDGTLKYPGHRRQRRADQALLRQSLRHRPVHDRRHHPRHQSAARRPEIGRRRLRLVRTRRGDARQGPGRGRHRHRNRSDARPSKP